MNIKAQIETKTISQEEHLRSRKGQPAAALLSIQYLGEIGTYSSSSSTMYFHNLCFHFPTSTTILILLRSIRIITNCLSHLKMSKLFSMIHRSQWKHLVYLFGNLSNSGGTNHLLYFCDIPPFDPKILFFVVV